MKHFIATIKSLLYLHPAQKKHSLFLIVTVLVLCMGLYLQHVPQTASNHAYARSKRLWKCNPNKGIDDCARKFRIKVVYTPASKNTDSGSELYLLKNTSLRTAYYVLKQSGSIGRTTFSEFKKAGYAYSANNEGVFVSITVKKKGKDVVIEYSAGI